MIRILTTEAAEATTITVDGQLSGDSVEAVETCSREAIGQGRPVHLFLREISTIDECGRALLCRLAEKRLRLSAAGIYSAYIVAGIRRAIESGRTADAAPLKGAGT